MNNTQKKYKYRSQSINNILIQELSESLIGLKYIQGGQPINFPKSQKVTSHELKYNQKTRLLWCCHAGFLKNHFFYFGYSFAVQANFKWGGGGIGAMPLPGSTQLLPPMFDITCNLLLLFSLYIKYANTLSFYNFNLCMRSKKNMISNVCRRIFVVAGLINV